MKIFAVYRNNKSFNPDNIQVVNQDFPVFYYLSETSLIRINRHFFYPDFSQCIVAESDFVIKINRVGKNIPEKFAERYYDEISMAVRFTAEDLFILAKENGMPWSMSKSWEGSVALGKFEKISELNKNVPMSGKLLINGNEIYISTLDQLQFSFNSIISFLSRFSTLKMGDLIFAGNSPIIKEIKIDDRILVELNGKKILDFQVR